MEFELDQATVSVTEGDPNAQVCVNLLCGTLQASVPIDLATAIGSAVGKYIVGFKAVRKCSKVGNTSLRINS